jgi:hypothetical protein
MGPRSWGDIVTEPWGLKDIAIVHEQLTIDLRPLADADPVRVEVTYYFFNTGKAKKLGLLFVSGEAGVSDFEASLDGKSIATRTLSKEELQQHWSRFPAGWAPPYRCPGFERNEVYCVLAERIQSVPVSLDLELPAGLSTFRARYRARACGTGEGNHPVVTWQLPYVLSPARAWGGFGALEVLVLVPDGWEAKSTPVFMRDGSTLRGHFDGLPADALMLATRSPVPATYWRSFWYLGAGYVLVWLFGGIACWHVGRSLGFFVARAEAKGAAKRAQVAWPLVPLLTAAALTAAVFVMGAVVAPWVVHNTLGSQETPYGSWTRVGFICPSLCLAAPLALGIGFYITQLSARRTFRRAEAALKIEYETDNEAESPSEDIS